MAIDLAHPFPQLNNKSSNILVELGTGKDDALTIMAIVPVPKILPRIINIKTEKEKTYCFLQDIIKANANTLFQGEVRGTWAFRITHENSDLYIDDEEVDNLLQHIEEELHKMRRGDAVRIEIEQAVRMKCLISLLSALKQPKICIQSRWSGESDARQ